MARKAHEATPNATLYNLRDARGMTQQDVADELNQLAQKYGKNIDVDNVTVSRWERGIVTRPSPLYRRLLAELFDVSLQELGFTRPTPRPGGAQNGKATNDGIDLEAFMVGHSPMEAEPRVTSDQTQWRTVRSNLNQMRPSLARTATELYEPAIRLENTGLLVKPTWVPRSPVNIAAIDLQYVNDATPPTVSGTEPETRAIRPLATVARRYSRYNQALRDIAHPGLFENRLCYRFLDASLEGNQNSMTFSHTSYFDGMDVSESLAHEMADLHLTQTDKTLSVTPSSWRGLSFRKLIDDPFDLAHRPTLASIDTLTIRQSNQGASFILHDRFAARVAIAGGTLHVMPAGVFQPSSIMPGTQVDDFDLWRNMMREYSEEFLGNSEHDGDGNPANYMDEPFREMNQALQDGRIRVFCLGIGLDALTLYTEILTVAVFDADIYDHLFSDMVHENDEGTIIRVGSSRAPTTAIPFDYLTVPRLLEHQALAPGAAGCLHLAWQHRDEILSPR